MIKLILSLVLTLAHAAPASSGPAESSRFKNKSRLIVRLHRAWARVLLAEMNKSEFLITSTGAGPGNVRVNLATGMFNQIPLGILAYVTYRMGSTEFERTGPRAQEYLNLRSRLRAVEMSLPAVEPAGRAAYAHLAPELRGEMKQVFKARPREWISRGARGVKLTLVAGVTLVLIADGVRTLAHVFMNPAKFEQKRAELQALVDEADYTLGDTSAR